MEWLNTQDIKLNLLHERDLTIARCNKGAGNLRLWVDEKGVHFEVEALKCDLGERALELVRSGVFSGCSFEFYPQEFEVDESGDEVKITHTMFRAITAITIGMDPAYPQTSVNARKLYDQTPSGQALLAKKELERERQISAALRRIREREQDSINLLDI